MIVVPAIVGFVVALFVVAAVIDLKARRRGVRYTMGTPAADPRRAAAQAEVNLRTEMGGRSSGFSRSGGKRSGVWSSHYRGGAAC